MKKAILIVLVFAMSLLCASDNMMKRVSIRWGLYNGYNSYPSGERPVFDVQDALIIQSSAELMEIMRQYGSEFRNLRDYQQRIKQGSFFVLLKPEMPQSRPAHHEISGTISFWERIEEDDDVEQKKDDGENEKGWGDPDPKNILADFLPPVLHQTANEDPYEEDMSVYRKEGLDAEFYLFDGRPIHYGMARRIIIVNNLNYPEWNQIGLAARDHLLELHFGR